MTPELDLDRALSAHFRQTDEPAAPSVGLDAMLGSILLRPQRPGSRPAFVRSRLPVLRLGAVGLALLLAGITAIGLILAQPRTEVRPRVETMGPMTTGRASPATALLPDGRVLIAGGWDTFRDEALTSAELFDPRTGRFTPTGSMHHGRALATATLLDDGTVLVAGGNDAGAYSVAGWYPGIADAEQYDPATGTFTPIAPMSEARAGHSATRLPDGRVLVAGGYGVVDGIGQTVASAELFDPRTGGWAPTGPLPDGRYLQLAMTTATGALIAGGEWEQVTTNGTRTSYSSGRRSDVAIYDAVSGTFHAPETAVSVPPTVGAAVLADGRTVLAGVGSGAASITVLAEDGRSARDIPVATGVHLGGDGHQDMPPITALPDGRVVLFGTVVDADSWRPATFLLDPDAETLVAVDSPERRRNSAAILLLDGRLLLAGGWDTDRATDARVGSDQAIAWDPTAVAP